MLTKDDDLSDIKEPGTYLTATASLPKNSPFQNAYILEVIKTNDNANSNIIQIATRVASKDSQKAERTLYSSEWMNWNYYVFSDVLANNEIVYKDGDTINLYANDCFAGFVTNGGSNIHFFIPLSKPISDDSKIFLDCSDLVIRGVDGYIVNDVDISSYTVDTYRRNNGIRVTISNNSTAFNAKNNTPVAVTGNFTIKLIIPKVV